jgi:hypothetical protein
MKLTYNKIKLYTYISKAIMDKPLMIKCIKAVNYICALLMIVDVFIRFTSFKTETDPFFFLLTFYLIGFAALLVVSEMGIKRILVFVEFLNGRAGKGFYILFVGLLMFDDVRPADMAISIILVLVGLFNVLASCMRDTAFNYYDESEYGSEEDEKEETET